MMNKIIFSVVGLGVLSLLLYFILPLHKEDSSGMNHSQHLAMIHSERDFLEHMIPHHNEAVETARIIKEKGGTLRPIKELAEAIEVGQAKEIEEMKAWYLAWYGTPYEDNGMYQPMMRNLNDLSGVELDKVFLEDMISHHEMAVVVAMKTLELQTKEEVSNLATKIINAQEREIVLMKDLLKLLPQ